jgi:hypothetical protein
MTHSSIRILTSITLVALLSACATQPAYREAQGSGYGYSQQALTGNQYRVHFKSRGDDTTQAMDYALLRASELTLDEGYDWFTVTNRETFVDKERIEDSAEVITRYETVQSCGLLTCNSYSRPVQQYQSNIQLGNGRSEVEVSVEIRMGRGIRPVAGESFDARELHDNLKPV